MKRIPGATARSACKIVILISSLLLNVLLIHNKSRPVETEVEGEALLPSTFDPVSLSKKISIFNHTKHRDIQCRYFTPSFDISVNPYPNLSSLLKNVNFNRYNQYYNVGVHLIETSRGQKRRKQHILEVSGSSEILRALLGKHNSFRKISYPEYNVLELHKNIEANKYDWVILDQVLEHVENPFQAILEIWRVLKPGGRLLLLVPSFYVYHYGPWDYWRLNCDSLKVLVSPFEAVELCGSHRSQEFVQFYLDNWQFLRKSNAFNPWENAEVAQILSSQPSAKHARWGGSNSPKQYGVGSPSYGDYVINSWIIARK